MGRFRDALARPGLQAIAEVKRRSPSAGDLRPDADPAAIAAAYEGAGAAAVSILVDRRFAGTWDDLAAARERTTLPLLAKGFFSTDEHLRQARESGADAILLILRDIDDETTARMMAGAAGLGLDTFVEAHDGEELARAIALGADPIGINARDLSTFDIDRVRQLELVAQARHATAGDDARPLVVAESGIWSRAQGAAAELAGADAMLVGSSLMRAPDPAAKLAELLSRPLVKVCGLTREEDVAAAHEAGADLAGFVLAEGSPRRAAAPLAVPDTMLSVGVFVGEFEEVGTDLVQLHAPEEGAVRGREAVLLRQGAEVARVLDLPWLGEDDAHWADAAARARSERVVLAGGLDAASVGQAIRTVRPWAVDTARGTEAAPGIKDHEKVRAFVRAARAAEGARG
ncbi:MAG: hypothetical protein R3C15_05695 [Thermoleophilia bacterium]